MVKGLEIIFEENRLFRWGGEGGDCCVVSRAGRGTGSGGRSQPVCSSPGGESFLMV